MKTTMIMTTSFVLLATVAIAGQPSPAAQAPRAEHDLPGADELVREKGRFAETWVHPDASLPEAATVYVWEPVFRFRDVEERPQASGLTTSNLKKGTEFAVTDELEASIRGVVTRAFDEELGRSKAFQLVDDPEAAGFILRPMVLDIVSHVPPTYHGTADVYLSTVGRATVVFDLVDARTGRIQARFAERQRIEPPSRMREVSSIPATSASIRTDVKRWARSAVAELRKELEKLAG